MLTPDIRTIYLLKSAGLICSFVLIAAWFFAYFKTKARGFALIGLSSVIGFTASLFIPILVVFSPMRIDTIRLLYIYYVAPAISVITFILTFAGIFSLVKMINNTN